MAISSLESSSIPLETLETLRNRLNQVHLSLRKLFEQIQQHNRHPNKVKFPAYNSLQSQFQVLLTQLHTLASNLDGHEEILKSTNVYPLPSFPATHQENLLTTLLRKKPLPEIDEWIDNAILKCKQINEEANGMNSNANRASIIQLTDGFAQWCSAKVEELQEEFQFWGFQTAEELEFSVTEEGKREKLEKERLEKAKVDESNKIKDGDKKPLTPNQVLKFMYQDVTPLQ